jgi:signal transduction histidine kinase
MGLLVVRDDRANDAFSPEDVPLLESLAFQVAVVIDNSHESLKLQERARLALLGQMAAGLAHEVKNPLGAIKGAAQLLSDSPGRADGDSAEFLRIILEEVERLDRVVGSVLTYARPITEQTAPIDVNSVVRRTLEVLSTEHGPNVVVKTEFAEGLPSVRGDAEHLRQVLINLVHNAIQAMDGRGSVEVSTSLRDTAFRDADSPAVVISVRDQGPGISEPVRESLFVPFFTTKATGTGLGLAISERLVGAMGGRIEVSSELERGATFSVVLPDAEARAGGSKESAGTPALVHARA